MVNEGLDEVHGVHGVGGRLNGMDVNGAVWDVNSSDNSW